MDDEKSGLRGVLVYAAVAIVGATVLSALHRTLNLSAGDRLAGAFILAAMWIPSLARLVALHTVDRGWHPPFPLRRWGRPRIAVVLMPLAMVSAIYLLAYALARSLGVATERPVWHGVSAVINIAINLPLLAAIGVAGGLGEELGWRGYLQPRLDQLGVRMSLLWVIVLETLFHVPLIMLGGYLKGGAWATSVILFFGLKLGATPIWTWLTYRWRSIWVAAWLHAFHNAVAQVLMPKTLGAGDMRVLSESGILPVAVYLTVAGVIFAISRLRGQRWCDLAWFALGKVESGREPRNLPYATMLAT
jgi:membrane protease YdiL (CAAX protease family)